MRRPLILGLLLFVACSTDPISIGAGDASTRDDAPGARDADPLPPDAEPPDAQPRDADPPDHLLEDAPQFFDGDVRDADPPDVEVDCRVPSTPAPPACDPNLCGNGVRNACQICGPGAGAPIIPPKDGGTCITQEEACDQGELGGSSCETRGWAWGQLSCNNTCNFDEGSCASCDRALAPAGCREGQFDGRDNVGFDVAANANAVAIAWVTEGPTVGLGSAVHVAILQPDFTPMFPIAACAEQPGQRASITDVSMGWLLAIGDAAGVRVVPLTFGGLPSGPERRIAGAREPRFISASTGARALLYTAMDGRLTMETVDVTGAVLASARPFRGLTVDEIAVSGAGNAQRWFVAARHDATEVAVLDTNLQRIGTLDLGVSTEYPMVSAAASGGFVSYADFSGPGQMYGQFLDDDGHLQGARHALGGIPDTFNPAPTVFDGNTGIALLGGYTGGTGSARDLGMARVTTRGVAGSVAVATAPTIRDWRAIAVGRDVIVGWRVVEQPGLGRIGLARLPIN